MTVLRTVAVTFLLALSVTVGRAQSAGNLNALGGLAPVTTLNNTEAGKVALAANAAVTVGIQNGTVRQPILLPFREQQEQALRDALITGANAFELADGLGSKLGNVYHTLTRYKSGDDGRTSTFSNISPAVANLMKYASATERFDSSTAKYFFANATSNGKIPASAEAMAILQGINGTTDIFGKAYNLPAGSMGADIFGNSRPFQTEPRFITFEGKDFFGVLSSNIAYLHGPMQDLTNSPSYPSGHTSYGYTEALLLALLVPERYPQMVARAAEYGNDRIIMAAHYAMDVLAGRTLALYDLAQLLANKPGYVGEKRGGIQIDDFRKALRQARLDVTNALAADCHGTIAICARFDHSRFAWPAKNRIFYESTQTYNLPVVFPQTANDVEDVGKLIPEAGYLLTTAFPYLTLAQADAILTETEGPGGGFLDDGSAFGVYSRLDLYRAAEKAIAMRCRSPRPRRLTTKLRKIRGFSTAFLKNFTKDPLRLFM